MSVTFIKRDPDLSLIEQALQIAPPFPTPAISARAASQSRFIRSGRRISKCVSFICSVSQATLKR